MSSSNKACSVSLAVLDVVSIIANFSMIVHIWKTRNNARKVDFIFAALGLSNFGLSVFIMFRALVTSLLRFNDASTSPIQAFLYGLYGVLSSQNLLLNVGIAYSRLCSVSQPNEYSSGKNRSRLQKKLVLFTSVVSNVLGVATGLATGFVQSRIVRNWIDASLRFLAYLLLCIIYGKIFWKVRVHNRSMVNPAGIGNEEGNSTTCQARLEHEKYLAKLFFGITVSFLIFNMPVMIIGTIFPAVPECGTVQGNLLTSAIVFTIIGMAFDPFWYFFLWGRIKTRQPAQTSPQDNGIRMIPA